MSTRISLTKLVLFVGVFLCSSLCSFSAENSLSGIDVQQIGESEYNVMLKLNNATNVQKIINADDNLTLVLKETVPTDSVEIVYDNAADLQNVIVQKKNNGDTLILLEGKDIENAKVFTRDLSNGLTVQNTSDSLFAVDKKMVGFSILGLLMLFLLRLSLRPKNERYTSIKANVKNVKNSKKVTVNTLRKKNQNQSRNIPSINCNVNGSFRNMSVPKDFVINTYMEEQIRKVG